MPAAPGILRWSPIQVLMRPNPAQLQRSDENGHVQGGMTVDTRTFDFFKRNFFFKDHEVKMNDIEHLFMCILAM